MRMLVAVDTQEIPDIVQVMDTGQADTGQADTGQTDTGQADTILEDTVLEDTGQVAISMEVATDMVDVSISKLLTHSDYHSMIDRKVSCVKLSNPANGRVRQTGTVLGSRATYSCNKGFVLVGIEKRVCSRNGKWSGKAPICKRTRKTFIELYFIIT